MGVYLVVNVGWQRMHFVFLTSHCACKVVQDFFYDEKRDMLSGVYEEGTSHLDSRSF